MKCRCGHEDEKHYGTEDKHCNALGCVCAGFVAVAEAPAPVVKVEEPKVEAPLARKPGRPKKSNR